VKLSIIVVAYNMTREIPRTLQSLGKHYQLGCEQLDYEVLVIDNGSARPLNQQAVKSCGPHFSYHYLDNPPPSPAHALNFGASQSSGEILGFMIDGAHLLTPGVFKLALGAFAALHNPVVMTRYFFLGPKAQNESILEGYDQQAEDALLTGIDWPRAGYRLFEIGCPLQGKGNLQKITWFNKMTESNALFLRRSTFDAIGGANEAFDIPGGGFLNMDMYREAVDLPGADPVQLIGEGSFHQYHGGTTTNVSPEERDNKVKQYEQQYHDIRGRDLAVSDKDVFYFGHLPTEHSKIHRRN
jgi:glycosyltransferase involved in cell wall biosynthesis